MVLKALFLAVALLFSQAVYSANTPSLRQDLVRSLGDLACGTQTPSPKQLWDLGVYDVGIEFQVLAAKRGGHIDLKAAERRARSLARIRHYRGYAFGKCETKAQAWVAVAPAPSAITRSPATIAFSPQDLNSNCQRWQIDFASGSSVKRLTQKTSPINIAPLGQGNLSITCKPQRPRWLGKQVWYLVPTKDMLATPHTDKLKTDDQASILRWINSIRGDAKLNPIIYHDQLTTHAQKSAVDNTIAHNKLLLNKAQASLAQSRVTFLGENRAIGESAQAMAWLLWNSPSHRQLLLNEKATHVGMTLRPASAGQKLLIVMLGEINPTMTAKSE